MKISVIIPVYNEEKLIGTCLDSLMKQSIAPDEIIVVDNNSTDNTKKIARKYPVRLLDEKKQGTTLARNKGFDEAQYEIIARTDGDTILPPNWIKQIKESFLDKDLVGLSGPAELYDLPKFVQKSSLQTKTAWLKIMKTYNTLVKKLLHHDCLYGPNCAIRKSAWKQIRSSVCLDDKQVHEDLDLAIHLAPLGKIKFSLKLIVSTSARRWKKPEAYLEYLYRGLKSIQKHKNLGTKKRVNFLFKHEIKSNDTKQVLT